MDFKDKIPEGYEVKTNMFGAPFLDRKLTEEDKLAQRRLFIPGLLLIAGIIVYLLNG